MAFVHASRVRETTTTTGTGDLTLSGAYNPSYRSFNSAIGPNNTCYYVIQSATEYEEGLGTVGPTGLTLARTSVIRNHLGGTAAINFAAGTKDVFVATLAPAVALVSQKNTFVAEQDFNGVRMTLDADADTWMQEQSDDIISIFSLAAELLRVDGVNKRVEVIWSDDSNSEGPEFRLRRNMTTAPSVNDPLGHIKFTGPDSALAETTYGKIRTMILDATNGSEDGMLQLSVIMAGTVTDHLTMGNGSIRLPSGIDLYTAGKIVSALNTVGTELLSDGKVVVTRSGGTPLEINRLANDGNLIEFNQAGTLEGWIAVSGSSVALTGAALVHEGSWEEGQRRSVPVGTVLEATKGQHRDEKLHSTKFRVAKPGYNPRVIGVFFRENMGRSGQPLPSYASGGTFSCRAKGPVTNGTLLCMSDQDGIAWAQADDIIRATTIGKVMEDDDRENERLVPIHLLVG